MMDKIELLTKMIHESSNIVFFGGAGVSTESGIKDFRSKDGLYHMKYKLPPETILSHDFFIDYPKDFYDFYQDKMNCLDAKPNTCHKFLVHLEKCGKLKAIITQNIDGLHSKAGSQNILELHGSIYRNYCMKCGKKYDALKVFKSNGVPYCDCGGIIKPDVVLYDEMLDENILQNSIQAIQKADMLIVAGTSLTVYPASGLIRYFNGKYLVIINNDPTDYDQKADLVIYMPLQEVFGKIKLC